MLRHLNGQWHLDIQTEWGKITVSDTSLAWVFRKARTEAQKMMGEGKG